MTHFHDEGGRALQKTNYFPSAWLQVRDPDGGEYLPLGYGIRGATELAVMLAWFRGRMPTLPLWEDTIRDNFSYKLVDVWTRQYDPQVVQELSMQSLENAPELMELCMAPFKMFPGVM